MEMSQAEHHQTKTCDPGAAAECLEHGNEDSKVKSGSHPIVEAGGIDACKFTSPVIGTPTVLLKCPTAAVNSDVISEITPVANGYEDDHSKCLGSIEGKVSSLENGRGSSDTAAKNFLSRERKKSKYLCYPFINLDKGSKVLHLSAESEIDDSKSPGIISTQHGDSSSLVKCSKRKRESRKSLTSSVKLETLTASSAELLKQLHTVALDHLNPYYNSAFDPTELLFNRFRASVFRGLSNSEVMGAVDIQNVEAQRDEKDANFHAHVGKQNKTPVRKMAKEKGKTGSVEKPPSGLYDVNVNLASNCALPVDSQMGFSPLPSNMKPQRKRKKEATMSAPVGPNLNCNNVEPTDEHKQAKGSGPSKGEPGKKKRMRKKGTTPSISYINGNSVKPISLEVCLQDAGPYPMATTSTGLNADVPNIPGVCGTEPKIPTPPPESQTPEKVHTTTSLETRDKSSAEVTVDQMKQSLEFMTAMLEKSANTISPETRASLEKEIKNLLKKVNPMLNSFPS